MDRQPSLLSGCFRSELLILGCLYVKFCFSLLWPACRPGSSVLVAVQLLLNSVSSGCQSRCYPVVCRVHPVHRSSLSCQCSSCCATADVGSARRLMDGPLDLLPVARARTFVASPSTRSKFDLSVPGSLLTLDIPRTVPCHSPATTVLFPLLCCYPALFSLLF